jgi:DNA-binding transcriptional regulator LsrR (DeoR family)
MSHTVCPTHCPTCDHTLPPAVPEAALIAARALLTLPKRSGTRREVAGMLAISPNRASQLLRDAEGAGLIVRQGRQGRASLWHAQTRLIRAYDMESA